MIIKAKFFQHYLFIYLEILILLIGFRNINTIETRGYKKINTPLIKNKTTIYAGMHMSEHWYINKK